MNTEVRFYKGKHKVKVLSESRGNWVVEALEAFEDVVDGEKIHVKVGEKRIVPPNLLYERESLPPPAKEHVYELKMEKTLEKIVEKGEKASKAKLD